MNILTTHSNPKSDRYKFRDTQELTTKQYRTLTPSHSLCINCSDYYDIPPCEANFNSDSGCFPSLINPNLN